jgi:signal transduction histidine kinase
MHPALILLTSGAFATLLLGLPGADHPVPELVLGLLFTALATAGFRWLRGRGRVLAGLYFAVQLPLAFALFTVSGPEVGTTLLLVVLVVQAVLLLPLPAAVAVTAAVPLVHVGMSLRDGLREGLGTLAAVAFAAVVTELLVREQRTRVELAAANEQLRGYAVQAEQLATTQERNRLARDIHDGLGHHLTVVQMQVKAARAVLSSGDRDGTDALLAKAQQQSEQALAEVRRSVSALREPRVEVPLEEALRALVAETDAAGVPTALTVSGDVRTLPPEVAETLYRIAQEGLTNVRKHARADSAGVVLGYGPGTVRLEVRDDGVGRPEGSAESTGFGLVGLHERVARADGTLVVESAPGRGLTLRAEVPA